MSKSADSHRDILNTLILGGKKKKGGLEYIKCFYKISSNLHKSQANFS